MSAMISSNSYDVNSDITIPVIASFDSSGHIAPIYVRLHGLSLKIHSYWTRSNFGNCIEYNCKVEDGTLLLNYYIRERVWTTPDK